MEEVRSIGPVGYIAALDIGSSRTTLAVAVRDQDGVGVRTYYTSTQTLGMEKYMISNRNDVSRCVRNVLKEMSAHLGFEITRVHHAYAGAGPIACKPVKPHLNCNSRESKESRNTVISEQDIETLERLCEQECDPLECIVDREAITYYADGTPIRSTLVGTYANTFSCNFNTFIVKNEADQRLKLLFNQLDLKVGSSRLGIRGSVEALSTREQRSQGFALLDVGYERTQLVVYYEDLLQQYAWIPRGGNDITRDITTKFRLEERKAEYSKINESRNLPHAIEMLHGVIDGRLTLADLKLTVETVIAPCVHELAKFVYDQLKKWDVLHRLPENGLVITGGGLAFPEIDTLFQDCLNMCRARDPKGESYPSLHVRVGLPPAADTIININGTSSTSDLMRLLPVIGAIQHELGNLGPAPEGCLVSAPAQRPHSPDPSTETPIDEIEEIPNPKGFGTRVKIFLGKIFSDEE